MKSTERKKWYGRQKIGTGLYRRRSGRIEAFVTVAGKTCSAGTHDTIAAAKSAQAATKVTLEKQREAGIPAEDKERTFAQHANDWFRRQEFRLSTLRSVRSNLDCHLIPLLGAKRLVEIKLSLLQNVAPHIAADRSPKTRRSVFQVLHWVMKDAFDLDLIHRDPTEKLKTPRVQGRKIDAQSPSTILRICGAMPSPYREAATIALMTGLRMGELLALKWTDLRKGFVRIERARDQATGVELDSPKTESGFRDVPLSRSAIQVLEDHRTRQRTEYAKLRRECEEEIEAFRERARVWIDTEPIRFAERAGRSPHAWNRWLRKNSKTRAAASLPISIKNMRKPKLTPSGEPASRRYVRLLEQIDRINSLQFERYVFVDIAVEIRKKATRRVDRLPVIDPHTLGEEFRKATKEIAGSKTGITFHSIRHAFASMLLREGGAKMIPALSKSLGHASPKFTMERYIHFIDGDEELVRDAIDRAIDLAERDKAERVQKRRTPSK